MKIGVLLLFLGIGLTGQIKSTSQAGLDAIHLPSESAVRLEGTDLTLVLKHMGFGPGSADLYVINRRLPDVGPIDPFLRSKSHSEQFVAKLKSILGSCRGSMIQVGTSGTLYCFHVET